MNRTALVLALAFLAPAAAIAAPIEITAFSLFGGASTQLGSNVIVNGGVVGSSGNVTFGTSSQASGDVVSGNNVTFSSGVFSGGNVIANNRITLNGTARVAGNVDAGITSGTAVTLGSGARVDGTITHNAGANVNFNGTSSAGGNVSGTPISYAAPTLPTAATFSAGTTSITKNGGAVTSLLAGSFDDIDLGNANILNLSAGNYYFDTLRLGGGSTINFNLSGGDISLFFTGIVNIGNGLDIILTGGDASDIFTETRANFTQGGDGEWFGTIFGSGSTSNISFGNNSTLTGGFIAANNLMIGAGSTVSLVSADVLAPASVVVPVSVPEPASIALFGIGLLGFASLRRKMAK